MIDSQLRPTGVNDRTVLRRMAEVPRENFVPERARSIAYMDRAVPLDPGPAGLPRFLPPPLFHGLMLQEAEPQPTENALVVDGGSGYLPELLRPLVGTLEVVSPEQAVRGEANAAPFSLILIDGAVEHVPDPLAALLASDGRAVTGLAAKGVTRLAAGRRAGESIALLPLIEIGIPVLPQFAKPKAWSF